MFATPWIAACQASLFLTIFWSLPKFMFIASMMPYTHLILWCPLLLLPSIFFIIRDFSYESSVIRWPAYQSFSFSEYLGLISLKIDWFDLLDQETFRSLLQHHSLKKSILWCSAFFKVQLSQLYVTTGKTIVLTIQTFVSRVISLLFNMLSRFVIVCLPRSNRLLISWLQSPYVVILEIKKRKSYCFHLSPSICHAIIGPDDLILVFYIVVVSSFILLLQLHQEAL